MGIKTGIEWTDATWNPLRGCSRVSEGCRNCYAERMAGRFSGPGLPYEGLVVMKNGNAHWTGKVELIESKLAEPLKWRGPRRIFVNSMSDLFHEDLSDEEIYRVLMVMALCRRHTFQILTKRPMRMFGMFLPGLGIDGWPLPNIWLGVSVEDQKTADERIPLLLQTPAAVRFISAEPLLGSIKLHHTWLPSHIPPSIYSKRASGFHDKPNGGIHWVIAGGESGPGARPAHPNWFRSLRDQCAATGVPFFFKQWGDWLPAGQDGVGPEPHLNCSDAPIRVGKKAAGQLLDGAEHREFPR